METYKLYQVSFDGAFVKDSEHDTLEEAEECSANLGSKWYFYPLSVIVKGKSIIETGGLFYNMASDEPILSEIYRRKRFTTLLNDLSKISKLLEMEGVEWEEFENEIINYKRK